VHWRAWVDKQVLHTALCNIPWLVHGRGQVRRALESEPARRTGPIGASSCASPRCARTWLFLCASSIAYRPECGRRRFPLSSFCLG